MSAPPQDPVMPSQPDLVALCCQCAALGLAFAQLGLRQTSTTAVDFGDWDPILYQYCPTWLRRGRLRAVRLSCCTSMDSPYQQRYESQSAPQLSRQPSHPGVRLPSVLYTRLSARLSFPPFPARLFRTGSLAPSRGWLVLAEGVREGVAFRILDPAEQCPRQTRSNDARAA